MSDARNRLLKVTATPPIWINKSNSAATHQSGVAFYNSAPLEYAKDLNRDGRTDQLFITTSKGVKLTIETKIQKTVVETFCDNELIKTKTFFDIDTSRKGIEEYLRIFDYDPSIYIPILSL